MAELLYIINTVNMKSHFYANGMQIQVSTGTADAQSHRQLSKVHQLHREEDQILDEQQKAKVEFSEDPKSYGSDQLAKVDIKEFQLLYANILFSTMVFNLGVL